MSDKIYLPESIPDGYVYGSVTNNYIELYNKPSFNQETTTYYRIYYNYSYGLVNQYTRTFTGYNPTTFETLPVSRDIFDRPDFCNIVFLVFIFAFFGIWLFNLMTSFIRKGGLLSGLI